MLSGKGLLPSFAGIARNPIIELPMSAEPVTRDVDAVIVSYLHADHFDEAAADLLRKDIPVLTPYNSAFTNPDNPSERPFFKQRPEGMGFTDALWRLVDFELVRTQAMLSVLPIALAHYQCVRVSGGSSWQAVCLRQGHG